MSNTVAKVYCTQGKVIPIPFDFTPSQIKPDNNQDIIVSFFDYLDVNKTDGGMAFDMEYVKSTNKVYDYYGAENCKEYISFMPYREKKQHIFCVSSSFLLEKMKENDLPSSDLSPVWTIDRYGITADEAFLALSLDQDINKKINDKKIEYSILLNKLEINVDKKDLDRITECKTTIDRLTLEEESLSKKCLDSSAECVATFLNTNYPVNAEVCNSIEPIIYYTVSKDVSDEEAVIIGNAIELLFDSIDPESIEGYFSNFSYDICSWPITINRTFDSQGKRLFVW
jgi:hypothetical protein